VLLVVWALGATASEPAYFTWRFSSAATDAGGFRAVAVHRTGSAAWGNDRGVTIERGSMRRRFATRGPVRDLAFDADGTLWIATDAGLWRIDPGGQFPILDGPQGAELVRATSRIAAGEAFLAIATATGVYWRHRGGDWSRVAGALGTFPVTGVALNIGAAPETALLWMSGERGLFRTRLTASERRAVARPVSLPAHPHPLFDVVAVGRSTWVLAEKQLFVAELPEPTLLEEIHAADWQAEPVTIPPGALPLRLAVSPWAAFLATDRGLMVAATPRGPWRRAAPPAGSLPVAGLAATADRVFLATRRGLVIGEPVFETRAPAGVVEPLCEPGIAVVQRAVLAYLKLRGDPLARQRRSARLRGYLPELRIEGVYERASDRFSRRDESFVSGATRHLFDSDSRSDRERRVAVVLSWEFGDVLYNPEEVDISAETRRLIELRDDVLDEVNQLYFDRQRALQAGEALRASELAAGLDAWTGGWFSTHFEACSGH